MNVNEGLIVDHLALPREHHEEAIYITPHICVIYTHKYDFMLNNSQHIYIFMYINVHIYMCVFINTVILKHLQELYSYKILKYYFLVLIKRY